MTISKEVDQLYRKHSGRLLTSLVAFFKLSNLQLAEDIVQNTFMAALQDWTKKGLPDDPEAWLYRVCKHKALNALKKNATHQQNTLAFGAERYSDQQLTQALLPYEIRDNQLRLLFALCHPDIPPKSRIILTLKTLGGLKVTQIAQGLGMQDEAVKKNLTRTRQWIKTHNLPLKVPFILQSRERLASVHHVLYLLFNEGYSATSGELLIRKELCLEAIRLTHALLNEAKISTQDTQALFALMLFSTARFEARQDTAGSPIELKDQDRNQWDKRMIQEGIHYFNLSKSAESWSKYHFEAAIAALYSTASTFEKTNWQAILHLYTKLQQVDQSPFVRLNRCVALAYAGQAESALQEVIKLKVLDRQRLYHLCLGEIYEMLQQPDKALNAYLDALALSSRELEKKVIHRKIDYIHAQNY